MKTLLIYPPVTVYDPDPTIPGPYPPLGLGYLASYLEKEGYRVQILDALAEGIDNVVMANGSTRYGLSYNDIYGNIKKYDPDIIGITSMFSAYSKDAHDIAAIAKEYNPNIKVVFGGAHSSIKPQWILKDKNIDVVVLGEGEDTLLELVRKYESVEDASKIAGIALIKNGSVIINEKRPFIKNLDHLPYPARHLLPMEIYLNHSRSPYLMRHPATTVITSRGCPRKCIYCSVHSVWRNTWRGRSAENVVDEIEFLTTKYDVREVSFIDDNVGANKKRLESICDELIERDLDIKWSTPNGIPHWTLDHPLLDKMKKSGCYRLTFGIESGNLKTREFIGKSYPLEQAKDIIKYANSIGVWTLCTFIIGFPYEDDASIKDTIKFAIDSETDYAIFFLLAAIPGTKIYDIFKNEGLINFDHILENVNDMTSEDLSLIGQSLASRGADTKYFSQGELQQWLNIAYKSFMRQRVLNIYFPIRMAKKIHSFEDLKYMMKLSKEMKNGVLKMILGRFDTHFALWKKK